MDENDYKREGTVAYLSALDVCSGHVFGIVEDKTGIKPFQKLVDTVMEQEPYKSAHRVFWIGIMVRLITRPFAKAYDALQCICPFTVGRLKSISLSYKGSHPMICQINRLVQNRILGFQEQYNLMAKPFNQDMKERIGRLDIGLNFTSRMTTSTTLIYPRHWSVLHPRGSGGRCR